MRGAGPNFSSTGIVAAVEHSLAGGNRIRISYANGDALVMPAVVHPTALSQVFNAAQAAARADVCHLSFWKD